VHEINSNQYQNELKRVKKELLLKHVETEKLGNDISSNHIDTQIKINELSQKKADLENEVLEIEKHKKQMLFDETQRIKNLAQAEIENAETLSRQLLDNLASENAKLVQLNETRGAEIMRLYAQIEELRGKADQ
jgi:hypothetical protein